MGVVLGLSAALSYGISDFFGGVAARRCHFLWVGLLVQLLGSVLAGLVLLVTPGTPDPVSLAWGAASGIGSALGTLALYRGYGHGEMAVVGPISAVGSAAVPALVAVALGERIGGWALIGVVLALPAIWLMSRPDPGEPSAGKRPGAPRRRGRLTLRVGVLDGVISGVGFGVLFIGLGQTAPGSGLWPVAAGQVVSTVLVGVTVLVGAFGVSRRPGLDARTALLVFGTSALSVTANVSYLFATRTGLLTTSAVLTALYPGFTVLLAVLVLRERPGRTQLVGLALAVVAVSAIVVG